MQDKQPVAFASRTLPEVEQTYSQIDKECLIILYGCESSNISFWARKVLRLRQTTSLWRHFFKKSLLTVPKRLQRMLFAYRDMTLKCIISKAQKCPLLAFFRVQPRR